MTHNMTNSLINIKTVYAFYETKALPLLKTKNNEKHYNIKK